MVFGSALKTLLNKGHRIKSFVYHSVSLSGTGDCMQQPREFEFIPI